ncbi:ATP-binding protein [Microvirga pudoricolor]|uniref:hypothetical protein n=1 Tax=Microvirga pudoricolor TaxID=2778729 RepID=UPI00194FD1EA|nr:hypothetical protein [Microvirga pudoricolor]MBM6593741.1 hypothetical protein [Microvirga pudoricolor]
MTHIPQQARQFSDGEGQGGADIGAVGDIANCMDGQQLGLSLVRDILEAEGRA